MTIHELINIIHEECLKRDFRHDMTPGNSSLFKNMCENTFEAVEINSCQEKCLIPQVGTLFFLYRGQNKEYIPCVPSLYRGNPSDVDIFIERMRLVMFERLLESHPVIVDFFHKHHFKVDVEGLAQHYGLKTSVLDLTSNLDIALFFATCWYDEDHDEYHFYDDEQEHEAVLYVFVPILDNEPTPSSNEANYLNHNIRPIGLQAFPRPGAQEGYGLHIPKGGSTKSYLYRFTFTCEDSKYYYEKFKKGESLWIKDMLIHKTNKIASLNEFSYSLFNETYKRYKPKGYSASKLKTELSKKVTLDVNIPDVVFSEEEKRYIKDDWNNETGALMASKIFRKRWFEHDPIPEENFATSSFTLQGITNEHSYRTLSRISINEMLNFMACPVPLKKAEWKNYTHTARPMERPNKNDGKWIEVPASMEDLFGKPFLAEKDWKIV